MKYILPILLILSISLTSASIYDLNQNQKEDICYIANLSFFECYDLWNTIDNLNLNQTCENQTIIINNSCETINMQEIQAMKNLNFDPIFQGREVIGWEPINKVTCNYDDYILKTTCEEEKGEVCTKGLCSSTCPTYTQEEESFFEKYWWLLALGVILFLTKDKIKRYFESSIKQYIPAPQPFKVDLKEEENPTTKDEEFG